jgi:hypothetical protein
MLMSQLNGTILILKEDYMDKALLDTAMEMPPNERLTFAELILASIDYEYNEIRHNWIDEVKNRMNAVNEGRARLFDFEGLSNES